MAKRPTCSECREGSDPAYMPVVRCPNMDEHDKVYYAELTKERRKELLGFGGIALTTVAAVAVTATIASILTKNVQVMVSV